MKDATHTKACLNMLSRLWRRMSNTDRDVIYTEFVPLPRGTTSDDGWLSKE